MQKVCTKWQKYVTFLVVLYTSQVRMSVPFRSSATQSILTCRTVSERNLLIKSGPATARKYSFATQKNFVIVFFCDKMSFFLPYLLICCS